MNRLSFRCVVLLVAAMICPARAGSGPLGNSSYTIALRDDQSVSVTAAGGPALVFKPVFTVLASEKNPRLGRARMPECNYVVPAWTQGPPDVKTTNPFEAAQAVTLAASDARVEDGAITWTFPPRPEFRLEASLRLPADGSEPRMAFRFEALRPGWYSIGYTGAPELEPAKADFLWQPLVWQEKRFPSSPVLSTEIMCSLPATLVTAGGTTYGLVADPEEIPFRMPNVSNSRFGVCLRNPAGNAQPMLFSPVLGLRDSQFAAGQSFSFRVRLFARPGNWFDTFRHLAASLYRFRDLRENTLCPLNETIENMIDFDVKHNEAGWSPEFRAFDYTTDVRGTYKLVSALHPMALAVIRDDEELFRQRALPMIEFLLSREKFLFAVREGIRGQNASHRMAGPGGEVFEWASLYGFSGGRCEAFRHFAEVYREHPRPLNLTVVPKDAGWVNDLAVYRATGEKRYLESAVAGAEKYIQERIDTPATDFSAAYIPGDGQFWTDFTPRWMQLFELYEETKDRRHLEAAVRGAELFAADCWVSPPVPDDTMITVNPGGKIDGGYGELPAPETKVPAWEVSQWGLTPEASTTYLHNPAIFLAHHAAYMLRIAHETGDPFFRTIARNAIIGRYASFPGYDINTHFTNIYATVEYPLTRDAPARGNRTHRYNQLFFNHLWAHIALLMDYLVSDAFVVSKGRIDFPSRYAQGYVYLQSKVYGDAPGRFYDDTGVHLYMPRGLLKTDNVQMNYVAGRGNGRLYVALLNQARRPAEVTLTFDEKLSGLSPDRTYAARIWRENQAAPGGTVERNAIRVPVAASGITALAIEGARPRASFQEKLADRSVGPLSEKSRATIEAPFGRTEALLLSFGRGLTSGYVYLTADVKQVTEARLRYRVEGQDWREMQDAKYPFEFSFPVADSASKVELQVEARPADGGETQRSATVTLTR